MTEQSTGSRAEPQDFPRRTPEVDALVDILAGQQYAGAVILGGPGMGKSSMVQTALTIAGRLDGVVSVQCSRNLRDVPYGALSPLLHTLPDLTTPVDVLRSMQQLGDALVIVVVDVQYLDAASAFVLAQLVQNRAAKLLAMGTASLGRESGIAALADTGVLRTIHMEPADPERVRRQCEQMLDGPLTEGTVRTIHGMTGGNPRLINAYLASARQQGVLVRSPDGAALPGRAAPWILLRAAPEPDGRLVDTVESMHDALLPGERETLDLVALAGRTPRSLLRAMAGEHVQDLLDAGFLRDGAEESVVLAAALHAEVLRAIISPGVSFDLYNRWRSMGGDAVEHRTARSVLWALECGQHVPMQQVLDAGYLALQAKDWPTARALAPSLQDWQDPRAALLVAELMLVGGRTWAARTELEHLAAHSTEPSFRMEALSVLAMNLVRSGEAANPWAVLPELIARGRERQPLPSPPPEALATLVRLLLDGAMEGHREKLMEQAQRVIDDPSTDNQVRAMLLLMQAEALSMAGHPTGAITAARQAYKLATTIPSFSARFGLDALVYLVICYVTAGHYREARQLLRDQYSMEPRKWHQRSGTILALEHLVESAAGQSGDALRRLEDAVVELRHHDPAQMLLVAEAMLSPQRTALTVGLPSPTAEERAVGPVRGPEGRWLLSMALFSVAEDRNPDAAVGTHPLWRRILDDPRLEHDPMIRREILLSVVLGRNPMEVETELMEELHAVAAATEGPRSAGLARVLDPALADNPRGLAHAAEATAATGDTLVAAMGWARLILLHHQTGDLRRRGEALRRLKTLQVKTGVHFPPFVSGALALGELTAREQEIVDLAAQGLSNAAVAEKLFVSQRTVEGHLYRVFTKLGITERGELRELQF
jgi:DNA-binding CsgD family transcriptional regulator/urease gamma subunit